MGVARSHWKSAYSSDSLVGHHSSFYVWLNLILILWGEISHLIRTKNSRFHFQPGVCSSTTHCHHPPRPALWKSFWKAVKIPPTEFKCFASPQKCVDPLVKILSWTISDAAALPQRGERTVGDKMSPKNPPVNHLMLILFILLPCHQKCHKKCHQNFTKKVTKELSGEPFNAHSIHSSSMSAHVWKY